MADPDLSLEYRRALKRQAARHQAAAVREEAVSVLPGGVAQADPRLLRIERTLDRMARQISGLPTSDGLRTMMIVLVALAVGAGLVGGSLAHP